MFRSCQSNADNKSRTLGIFTLTLEQLKQKWWKQYGKCAISGVQMNIGMYKNFKCSPERLDNSLSYTDDNVVLIIAELNVGQNNQFTRKLLLELCTVDTEEHPLLTEINTLGSETLNKSLNSELVSKLNEYQEEVYQCVVCQIFELLTNFTFKDKKTLRRNRMCKGCEATYRKKRSTTINGKLTRILSNARNCTKRRNSRQGRCKTVFDITKRDLIALLQMQKGKCAYSHKNLTFDGNSPFHISLERRDVNVGYIKSNIVFICQELNTFDLSVRSHDQGGNSAWSIAKFDEFRNQVNNDSTTTISIQQ